MHAKSLAALAVLGGAAIPASAQAAAIAVNVTCAPTGSAVTLTGTGFTPNGQVNVSGAAAGTATADAVGNFTTSFSAPSSTQFSPKTATINAVDAANPALTGTTSFQLIRTLFDTNKPLNGKPTGTTTWKFVGFLPGQPIYGHYRFGGKTIRNYRFGTAKGACGTLTVRARRLPAKSRPGTWRLQIDQKKSYNRYTKPRLVLPFTITRRFF